MVARETLTFPTHDEAVAEALRGAPPGDVVEIHGESCKGREDPQPPYDVIGCTCTPMRFVVGATA